MANSNLALIIAKRADELAALRPAYVQAKELVNRCYKSEDILSLARLMESYRPGDSPEKAIYVLAQAAMLVAGLAQPFALVKDYENKEANLNKLRKDGLTC